MVFTSLSIASSYVYFDAVPLSGVTRHFSVTTRQCTRVVAEKQSSLLPFDIFSLLSQIYKWLFTQNWLKGSKMILKKPVLFTY